MSTLFVDLLLYFFLLPNIKVSHHDFYPRFQLHRKPIVPDGNLLIVKFRLLSVPAVTIRLSGPICVYRSETAVLSTVLTLRRGGKTG